MGIEFRISTNSMLKKNNGTWVGVLGPGLLRLCLQQAQTMGFRVVPLFKDLRNGEQLGATQQK